MCVKVSVCSSPSIHMRAGVYESVAICACVVLRRFISEVLQLCTCISMHMFL